MYAWHCQAVGTRYQCSQGVLNRIIFAMTKAVLVSFLVATCTWHASPGSATSTHGRRGTSRIADGRRLQAGEPLAAAASTQTAQTCPLGYLNWPVNSQYCWQPRDTGGKVAGPGSNRFRRANAYVSASDLVVQVRKDASGRTSCGEVELDKSLGLGDYIFVVKTDPNRINANLVASPFLYADDHREFDIEFSKWGNSASKTNSQYVIQPPPGADYALQRFNIAGTLTTHRIRWAGSRRPGQIQFESYSSNGKLLQNWTGAAPGNNFKPGDERVHINHWITNHSGSLPTTSKFILSCFKFCPKGQETSCSSPLSVKPCCDALCRQPVGANGVGRCVRDAASKTSQCGVVCDDGYVYKAGSNRCVIDSVRYSPSPSPDSRVDNNSVSMPSGPLMVGYYQSWSAALTEDRFALDLVNIPAYVNIINLSFARPDCSYTRGSYNLADSGIELTASQAAVLKASIAALKAKQPNTRVLLSVGGGNQEYNRWDRMNLDCLKGIVDGFGFHGIDIDYEKTPSCSVSAGSVTCPTTDAESVSVTAALRDHFPKGQYLLSMASYHVGMFGEGEFAASQPAGSPYKGANLAVAKSAAGQSLDLISIMAYDAGNKITSGFDWQESYRAHRALWKTQAVAIGVEIPPEAWGGNEITLSEVTARAQFAKDLSAGGAQYGIMVWSLQKPGCPSAQQVTSAVCKAYAMVGDCDSARLPFEQQDCARG